MSLLRANSILLAESLVLIVGMTAPEPALGAPPTAKEVEEAVALIQSEGGSRGEDSRIRAYRTVAEGVAVLPERAFNVLANGLADPLVSDICAKGLLHLPPARQREAVELVTDFLRAAPQPPKAKEGPGVDGVIRAIAAMGPDGLVYIDVLDAILHDSTREQEVRHAAAVGIVQLEPLEKATERFRDLDDRGIEAAITAWPQRVAVQVSVALKAGKSYYDENRATVGVLRSLVLEALQSSRVETRKAAFDAMTVAYGPEFVVIRSPDDYEVDPELRDVLQGMARSDPEPDLRERAAKLLDPDVLARRVAKILRNRESPAKQEKP